MITVSINPASLKHFGQLCTDLAAVSNRTVRAVIEHQGALFARDAMFLTPPFGKNPIKESWGVQRKAGEGAVKRDVSFTFKPLSGYGILRKDESGAVRWDIRHGDLGANVMKAVRRKDYNLAEFLLHRAKLKPLAVIEKATVQLHEQKHGKGSTTVRGRSYRVARESSIKSVAKELLGRVGMAKAGWVPAMRRFQSKEPIPNWITRHAPQGGASVSHPAYKASVSIWNAVKFVQNRASELVPTVWRIRTHLLRKNLAYIERAVRRSFKNAENGVVDSKDSIGAAIAKAF